MGTEGDRRIEGIRRKLDRGHEHLQDAMSRINAFIDTETTTLSTDPDLGPAAEYPFQIHFSRHPDRIDWGLRLGDGIQNLRSALDSLVWHLAIKATGQDPPPNPTGVGFPIFESEAGFRKGGSGQIESLDDCPRTIIEWVQPYHGRHGTDFEPLWFLNKLSNVHKHRIVTPVFIEMDEPDVRKFVVSNAEDASIIRTDEPLEDGATVFKVRFDQPTYVNMDLHFRLDIGFDLVELGLADTGIYRATRALNEIVQETKRVAAQLAPFV